MTNLFNKLLNKLTSEDTSTWFVQQVVGGPGDTVYALTIAEGRQKFHAQLLRLEGGEWVQLCADKHDEICESFAVGIRDDVMVTRSGGTLWMWEDGEIYELGSLNVHSPLVVPFDEETFLIVGFNDDNIDVAFYYDILHDNDHFVTPITYERVSEPAVGQHKAAETVEEREAWEEFEDTAATLDYLEIVGFPDVSAWKQKLYILNKGDGHLYVITDEISNAITCAEEWAIALQVSPAGHIYLETMHEEHQSFRVYDGTGWHTMPWPFAENISQLGFADNILIALAGSHVVLAHEGEWHWIEDSTAPRNIDDSLRLTYINERLAFFDRQSGVISVFRNGQWHQPYPPVPLGGP